MARLEVKLARHDRVYRPPDVVDGALVVTSPSSISHQGIRLTALGSVLIQPSTRSVGVIESLYISVKPILLMQKSVDLSAAGKIGLGKSEFPFRFALDVPKDTVLYETYHGAYINVQYIVTVEVLRGYLQKPLSASVELMVEGGRGRFSKLSSSQEVNLYITQDTQKELLAPSIRAGGFKVVGKIPTQCFLGEPITGELVVEHCAMPISSIDIRILRVETVLLADRLAVEKSEVQNTQIADGDVCRGLALPIYVILPRLLTCPVVSTGVFSIEFEISIVVSFDVGLLQSQSVAQETLPLRLFR